MATFTTATSLEDENRSKETKRKPPSKKVRKKSESKRCYMHPPSVRKKEKLQDFTRTRWETYRRCLGQWLALRGDFKDVAETHKHCADVAFERVPADAGFHATCYRRFIDKKRLAAAEKRLLVAPRTSAEDPDADAGQSAPSSDRVGAEAATPEAPRKKRRSRTGHLPVASAAGGPVPPGSCIICQRVDKYVHVKGRRRRDQLSQAKTLSAGPLLKAAEMKGDSTVFDNICVALEVRYHKSCYKQYIRFLSKSMAATTDEEMQDKLKRRSTRELAQLVFHCPPERSVSELVFVETLSADKRSDRLPQPSGTETTTESTELAAATEEESRKKDMGTPFSSSDAVRPTSPAVAAGQSQKKPPEATLPGQRSPDDPRQHMLLCLQDIFRHRVPSKAEEPLSMSNSDGCVSSHSMSPQCRMHSSLSSAAPWRTDGCMPLIFTLEDNCTEAEAGYLSLLPVCKKEVSPEQQEMSPGLVHVKPEPPQIKEEQQEELLQRPEEAAGSTLTLHRLPYGSRYSHRMEYADFPVCKEEVCPEQEEKNSSLVQEEPEPPQIKEEQEEELLQRPEEAAGSTLTLLAVKSEDDDDENRETVPLASTSTEHMKTEAYIEYWVPSQPAGDDTHCSESDTDDSDDWEETREDQSALNKLNLHETDNLEGQHSSLSNKLSQDSKSSKLTPPASSQTTENKSYSCTECGKCFVYMCHLKRHMRVHTGEKPFACAECSQVFSYKSHMKRHMSTHTGEKLFTCTECGKDFVYMSHLNEHMRTHTGEKPFNCTECGKLFGYMSHLKRHMRTHTGDKPFTCTQCGKLFNYKSHLKQHMISHTDRWPPLKQP